jgi:hypothetical protein
MSPLAAVIEAMFIVIPIVLFALLNRPRDKGVD